MLPLAVGNSWDYEHGYFNYLTEGSGDRTGRYITIRITHTEDIEGYTYYVFSPMPYEDPPVLSFFPAGQKVRFDGNNLVFRGREGDIALYQFKSGDQSYSIPETESDTLVVARGWGNFELLGHGDEKPSLYTPDGYPRGGVSYYYEWRQVYFSPGLGIPYFSVDGMLIQSGSANDQYHMKNHLRLRSATINGEERDPETFRYPYTVVRETSWGALKRTFAHPDEED